MKPDVLKKKVSGLMALHSEDESKNWFKIPLKFALWFIFMAISFYLLKKKKITEKLRPLLYGTAIIVFGIILGADPSPMGTVKDAIVLFGKHRVIFPPRMIAFSIFLATVIVANKFICSWGCQFGALQDLIFRLNRNKNKGIMKQYKVPFVISQSIRVTFFVISTIVAIIFVFDVVGLVDPFKVYKPMMLSIGGALFLVFIQTHIYFNKPAHKSAPRKNIIPLEPNPT